MARIAEIARQDGLLALEQKAIAAESPFISLALQLTADGSSPEVIESVLRGEMEALHARHKEGKAFFDQWGKLAPAFGMIGTLLGLIMMLGNLNDPDSLGPGMAVALITTLYGSLLSNCLCLPIAEKLAHLNREELRMMELIVRGVLAIQAGDGPRLVLQKLESFVPAGERDSMQYRMA
jgi:chemotaxis protein MotA